MSRIFVIDDEKPVLGMIQRALEKEGHTVDVYTSPSAALAVMKDTKPDAVITDIKMEGMNGFDVLRSVKGLYPELNIILITAHASIDTAVAALRGGAFDYLMKPFKIKDLRLAVQRALSAKKITHEAGTQHQIHRTIIGASRCMEEIEELITKVARTDSTVLIEGESGTGKELVARNVHTKSARATFPFVSVNCAALPDTLLESELFGFEKGSFTGAFDTKVGLVEFAHGGSLFLDEIGEISPAVQVKLLRVLQEKEIKRVGGMHDIPVDVRIIVATSRKLRDEVAEGRFREDLFYRLNVVPITMPPLRERKEDIPLLVEHFLSLLNKKVKRQFSFADDALAMLKEFHWPGNVRELENTIERVGTLADTDAISSELLCKCWGKQVGDNDETKTRATFSVAIKNETEAAERDRIVLALRQTGGNKLKAAEKLDISRQSLQYKIRKYGI